MPDFIDAWKLYRENPSSSRWSAFLESARPAMQRLVMRSMIGGYQNHGLHLEDLIQECLLHFERKRSDLLAAVPRETDDRIRAYLYFTASNVISDYWRAQNAKKRSMGPLMSLDDLYESIELASPSNIEREVLFEQINQFLSNRTMEKSIFWLYYRQGMTAKEIASIPAYGLSPKAVENLLAKLTRELREWLKGNSSGS